MSGKDNRHPAEKTVRTGKTDRRIRKSRAAIFEAFEQLLSERSYSFITVGDIIDRADVGRTTFYSHFPTKDALLEELCRDLFSHISDPASEAAHDFGGKVHIEDKMFHMSLHLEEESERLCPLFKGPASSLFWNAFSAESERFFMSEIGPRSSIARRPSIEDGLYARYLASTFTNVIRWQLAEGAFDAKRATVIFFELAGIAGVPVHM